MACATEALVMISVVIPTKDRPLDLIACLRGLSDQDAPHLLSQVIVVDDGSRQPYCEQVSTFARTKNLPLIYSRDSIERGAARARNCAAAKATGTILAFLDDDSIPSTNWLRVIGDRFARQGNAAITGRILPTDSWHILSQARQLRYERRQGSALASSIPVEFFAGGNAAIMRGDFENVGGFDESFVSMHDQELVLRLMSLGRFCFYAHEMVIHHRHYKGLSVALRQSFTSAYYRRRLEQRYRHGKTLSLAQKIESHIMLLRLSRQQFGHSVPGIAAVFTELVHSSGYLWYALKDNLGTTGIAKD